MRRTSIRRSIVKIHLSNGVLSSGKRHNCQTDQRPLLKQNQAASYFNRSAKCSPTRIALAIAVSEGFTAPILTKKLVSTTYKLSSSCALQFTSRTEVFGSVPKRHVPAW